MIKPMTLILVAVMAATAGDPPPAPKTDDAVAVGVIVEMLRIKDPVTGEIRKPTADELRLLMHVNPLSRKDDGLVSRVQKDGTVAVDLEGRFQCAVMAKIGPDGKVVTACVSHEHAARTFLEGGTTSRKKAEEEVHDM